MDLSNITSRVNEVIPIYDVMTYYGIRLKHYADTTQQYPCPFHKEPGKFVIEDKASARYYADTNTTYCWACRKSYNSISFISLAENTTFNEAFKIAVDRYKVDITKLDYIKNTNNNSSKDFIGVYEDIEKSLIKHKKIYTFMNYVERFKKLDECFYYNNISKEELIKKVLE
jgi:DNA primase